MEELALDTYNHEIISCNKACALVDVFVGPAEINEIYGTTLSEEDCPLGFTREDIVNFRKRIQKVLPDKKPFIVLALMIERDGQGNQIDHEYIGKNNLETDSEYNKIGTLVFWYYPPFWHKELHEKSAIEKLTYTWVLSSLYGSGIYCTRNPDKQIASARRNGEKVLSYLEETYLQQTMLASEIASGNTLKFFDLEKDKLDNEPLNYPHDTRVTRTEVCGEQVVVSGCIPDNDRFHQRVSIGRVERHDGSDPWYPPQHIDSPLATAILVPILGGQPKETRFDKLKEFWESKPIFKTLKINILEIRQGFARVGMSPQKEYLNHFDGLSGSIIAQLADCAMGVALSSITSHMIATRVLETEFLSSVAAEDTIEAVCKVTLRDGKEIDRIRNPKDNKLVSLTAKVHKSNDPNNQIVSVHNGTFVVLPDRKS